MKLSFQYLSLSLICVVSLWASVNVAFAAKPESISDEPPQSLGFSEFFKRPVGPYGLEPTQKLLSLSGRPVTLTGFAVQGLGRAEGPWILSPVPMRLGDEDESLSDDLPSSIAHLEGLSQNLQEGFRNCLGKLAITGTLGLGPRREADERISYVRVRVDRLQCIAESPRN